MGVSGRAAFGLHPVGNHMIGDAEHRKFWRIAAWGGGARALGLHYCARYPVGLRKCATTSEAGFFVRGAAAVFLA